jgi:hypothetical protein
VYTCAKVGPRSVTDETFPTTTARYVQVAATQKNGTNGYTLFEFMVLNDSGVTAVGPGSRRASGSSGAELSYAAGTIRYSLPAARTVKLELLDGRGKRVATLAEGMLRAGRHEAELPAGLGHGVYLIRLRAGTAKLATLQLAL